MHHPSYPLGIEEATSSVRYANVNHKSLTLSQNRCVALADTTWGVLPQLSVEEGNPVDLVPVLPDHITSLYRNREARSPH